MDKARVFSQAPFVKVLSSVHNETFRRLQRLLSPKGIKKLGQTLVFGEKIVRELMVLMPHRIEAIVTARPPLRPDHDNLIASFPRRYELSRELFTSLDIFRTRSPFAVVAAPPLSPWDPSRGPSPPCSLLLPFQDPDNLGAAVRSGVAFGVREIIILREGASPYHPKAIRSSAGAVFKAHLLAGPSLSRLPEDIPVVALDVSGRAMEDFPFPAPCYLLPGIEGPGLPISLKERAIRVPFSGEVESLNATVALSLVLYHLWSRRH